MANRRNRLVGWMLFGIFCGPLTVMSVYLGLSRWPTHWCTAASDWTAIGVAVGVGTASIARLPLPAGVRMVLALAYVPVAGCLMLVYSVYFVGVVFGDWL